MLTRPIPISPYILSVSTASFRYRRAQAGHDATQRRAQTVAVAAREKAAAALILDDAAVVAQAQMASGTLRMEGNHSVCVGGES